MHRPTPLACDLHDYLELACIREYDVQLTLTDATQIEGRATTTRTSAQKIEYFVIKIGDELIDVPTLSLASLRVMTPHAGFTHVDFTSARQKPQ